MLWYTVLQVDYVAMYVMTFHYVCDMISFLFSAVPYFKYVRIIISYVLAYMIMHTLLYVCIHMYVCMVIHTYVHRYLRM